MIFIFLSQFLDVIFDANSKFDADIGDSDHEKFHTQNTSSLEKDWFAHLSKSTKYLHFFFNLNSKEERNWKQGTRVKIEYILQKL